MALTNYNILVGSGTVSTDADTYTVTYNLTQGEVLNALKGGIFVVLKTYSTDSSLGNEICEISYINDFIHNTRTGDYICITPDDMVFTLNEPDEPLSFTESEGGGGGGEEPGN